MSIGANIAVITAGAVLSFAVRLHTDGLSVHAVGGVLMAVGAVGLVLQIKALLRQRELTAVQAQTPPETVLVRPSGAATVPPGIAGTTAEPLHPGDATYPYHVEGEW